MTLDEIENDFKKAVLINFDDYGYSITLFFPSKQLAFEIYSMIGVYFDNHELTAVIEVKEDIKFSIVSKQSGEAINSNDLQYSKNEFDEFLKEVSNRETISLFTGYTHKSGFHPSLVVSQQKYRLRLVGYTIV